jgi:hypothetical protein
MISQPLLKELNTIMIEDYGKNLTPTELISVADSLVGFFGCLVEINNSINNNGQQQITKPT